MLAFLKNRLLRLHRRLLPNRPEIGWMPYLWLVYLIFFYFKWYFVPFEPVEFGISLAATALFLALYFRGYWLKGRRQLFNMAAICALGVILGPVNPGASVFFIYAASYTGHLGGRRRGVAAMAGINAIVGLETLLLDMPFNFWFWPLLIGNMVGLINLYYAELERKSAALKLSQDEVRRLAATAERERIARDLHDVLGHTLSVIAIKAELAGKLITRQPTRAVEEILAVQRIAREALAEVRDTVRGYRAAGLASECASARLALEAAGIRFEAQLPEKPLPPQTDSLLAIVLREAVTNILRHAPDAGICELSFVRDRYRCSMTIRDDNPHPPRKLQQGSGLTGMRERLEQVGGRLDVAINGGMTLTATVPLPVASDNRQEAVR